MPTLCCGPVTSSPSSWTVPRDGSSRPDTIFMSVDLPQPEGPTIEMNSPVRTDSVMSSTAKSVWPS